MFKEDKRAKYSRSKDSIELIITYACNLKCHNCEAMVRQAPSNESMTIFQIEKFIKESIEHSIQWKNIRILGGEPTIHKNIYEIVELLISYKKNYSENTKITLVTNGFGRIVREKLSYLSTFDIEIENSNKTGNIQPQFHPVNIAPIDLIEYKNTLVDKGCWITSLCGIALDSSGYYPCSTSAAIDRVFGFDLGLKELPNVDDEMEMFFSTFCKLCGHYNNELNYIADFNVDSNAANEKLQDIVDKYQKKIEGREQLFNSQISETWDRALKAWRTTDIERSKY